LLHSALWSAAGYWDNITLPISTFSPIPELRVPNRDLVLLFLQNNVNYYKPVLDPWFKASRITNLTNFQSRQNDRRLLGLQVFRSARSRSVLGCTEQYEFCNATYCSIPDGLYNSEDGWHGLSLNNAQKVVISLLRDIMTNTTLGLGARLLGSSSLRARDGLWNAIAAPISGTLGPQQWEVEVEGFMSITLSALQRMVADFANPPDIPIRTSSGTVSSRDYVALPGLPDEDAVCRNIRIRDENHLNFSVAGIAAVFATAGAIILANLLCLPGLAFWLRQRLGHSDYSRREWVEGHIFRLQRRLWESKGIGRWSTGVNGWDLIPVSMDGGIVFEAEKTWHTDFEA